MSYVSQIQEINNKSLIYLNLYIYKKKRNSQSSAYHIIKTKIKLINIKKILSFPIPSFSSRSPMGFQREVFLACLQTAAINKAIKAIIGKNLSTSIVEGSVTKDLKGSLRDTGTTSYEFTNSFRSTCIFKNFFTPYSNNLLISLNSAICDLYVYY